jgi:hypothetical protein
MQYEMKCATGKDERCILIRPNILEVFGMLLHAINVVCSPDHFKTQPKKKCWEYEKSS